MIPPALFAAAHVAAARKLREGACLAAPVPRCCEIARELRALGCAATEADVRAHALATGANVADV